MRKMFAVLLSVVLSLMLGWMGWFLFGGLGFAVQKLMDTGWLASFFLDNLVTTVLSLVLVGLSIGITLYACRRLGKGAAIAVAAGTTMFAGMPVLLSMNVIEGVLLGSTLVLGMAVAAYFTAGDASKGFACFSKGMGGAKKAFYALAIIGGILVLMLAVVQQKEYEDSFKASIKQVVSQSSSMAMSKDQIRALIQAQGTGSSSQQAAMLANMNYSMSKAQIRANYEPFYVANNIPVSQLDAKLDEYYAMVNSQSNIQLRQQAQADAVAQLSSGQSTTQVDAMVDAMYAQMNDPTKSKAMAEASAGILENMPMFKQMLAWLAAIYAFTFASLVLLLESFLVGPAAGMSYCVLSNLMGDDKVEKALERAKDEPNKLVDEFTEDGKTG
jgi:hypothetical protein